jgi:DNA-binding winged helix-turn-helix (wHTH) protein
VGSRGENKGIFVRKAAASRFGPFTLDVERRRLDRGGADVHLTPKAFDLLSLLVSEAPRVIPKAELHQRLWPGTFVSDATLAGLIKEVRKALDDYDSSAPIIRTTHRIGYAFEREVEAAGSQTERVNTGHWLVGTDKRFPLAPGENVIGRDPGSGVWLDATGVSRRHARIAIGQSGARLEDLGSKNGTKVGNQIVVNSVPLGDGDRIVIGNVSLIYRISASQLSTETHMSTDAAQTRRRDR